MAVQCNGDAVGGNYASYTSTGTVTVGSAIGANIWAVLGVAATLANSFTVYSFIFPFYRKAANKMIVLDSGNVYNSGADSRTFGGAQGAGSWQSVAAINRLTLTPSNGQFVAGCRVLLYGQI
jgi:hypothetical protein